MAWEVQHYTLADGWINTWSECVGEDLYAEELWQPVQFDTRDEAEAALAEFFADIDHALRCGDIVLEHAPARTEYRIGEVEKEGA